MYFYNSNLATSIDYSSGGRGVEEGTWQRQQMFITLINLEPQTVKFKEHISKVNRYEGNT